MSRILAQNETRQAENGRMFSVFRPMIQAAGGLTLGQVCSITRLEASTVQNWIKRGFVARPVNKKYYERQLARILLIDLLRDCMQIERIGELCRIVNGSTEDSGDDLIPESVLVDRIEWILNDRKEEIVDEKSLLLLAEEAVKDYEPNDPTDKTRLHWALKVMLLAATSVRFKQKAEKEMDLLSAFTEKQIRKETK